MLKQSKRIAGRTLIQTILEEGKQVKNPLFTIFRIENSLGVHRYAVIIGKKLEKSAVKRNLERRRVYEAIRLILKENPDKDLPFANNQAHDTVILLRSRIMKTSFKEIKTTLLTLL